MGKIAGGLPGRAASRSPISPTNRGRILTEMSVMHHGPDDFMLITAATAQWHDREWLRATSPRGSR
jgi:dimethylglycine dehydrogenase